jgi:hypothetical protein
MILIHSSSHSGNEIIIVIPVVIVVVIIVIVVNIHINLVVALHLIAIGALSLKGALSIQDILHGRVRLDPSFSHIFDQLIGDFLQHVFGQQFRGVFKLPERDKLHQISFGFNAIGIPKTIITIKGDHISKVSLANAYNND